MIATSSPALHFTRRCSSPTAEVLAPKPSPLPSPLVCPCPYPRTRGTMPERLPTVPPPSQTAPDQACSSHSPPRRPDVSNRSSKFRMVSVFTTDSRSPPETTAKGMVPVSRINVLQHFRNHFQLRQNVVKKLFLPPRHIGYGHRQSLLDIERSHNLLRGASAPRVKRLLAELTAEFRKNLVPCHVMQRHRIRDRSVAIKQIRLKISCRDL